MSIAPLQLVPLEDVACLAGAGSIRIEAVRAEVVIGDAGTVVVAEPGDDLAASGVRTRETFALVGPIAAEYAERFLGSADWSSRQPVSDLVHVFVRRSADALYLGTARQGSSHWTYEPHVLTECLLYFDQPLAFDTLDEVRPPTDPGDLPRVDWLELIDTDRSAAMRQFIEGWHEPAASSEAVREPVLSMPAMLAEFYRFARHRQDVLGVQNFICPPHELRLDDAGCLEFGYENQGGFVWTLEAGEGDPPGWTCEPGGRHFQEHEPLSGFLIQFSLFEAVASAPYRAWTMAVPALDAERLTSTLRQVPLKTWMWPLYRTSFYIAPGMIVAVDQAAEEHCNISIGATHRSVLRPLADLDISWSGFDG